jgi:hypothetical protein
MGTNIANEQAYKYCYRSIISVDKLLEDLFSWLTKVAQEYIEWVHKAVI